MLWIGEPVGSGRPGQPRDRHRRRPAGGHQPRRHGQANAITVLAASEAAGCCTRPTPTSTSCAWDRSRRATSTSASARPRTCAPSRRRCGAMSRDITIVILERPRHEAARSTRSASPARASSSSATATCRRPSAAPSSGTGVHARAGHRRRAGGRPHGRGAALPGRRDPGALPLPQRRGARARRADGHRSVDEDRVFTTEDLAPGEDLVFAATGVTEGDLLDGVRFFGGGARTHSLVMALPGQAGPLRGHGPHVRPQQAAQRAALASLTQSTQARAMAFHAQSE